MNTMTYVEKDCKRKESSFSAILTKGPHIFCLHCRTHDVAYPACIVHGHDEKDIPWETELHKI